MATLTIRDLDESLKRSLRIRAASRNRSMEEEARQILRAALAETQAPAIDMASRIRSRFADLGDIVLTVPAREAVRTPPAFGEDAAGIAGVAAAVKTARTRRRP